MRRSRSADQAKFFCVFQSNGGKHEASAKRESRARGEEQQQQKKNHHTDCSIYFPPPTPLQSPTNHSIQKKSGVKRFVHRPHVWPIIKRPPVKTVLRFSCIDMNENDNSFSSWEPIYAEACQNIWNYGAIELWRQRWTKAKTTTNTVICRGNISSQEMTVTSKHMLLCERNLQERDRFEHKFIFPVILVFSSEYATNFVNLVSDYFNFGG